MGLLMGNDDWVKRIARNRIQEGKSFLMFSWDKDGKMLVSGTKDIQDEKWWEVFDEVSEHTTLKTPQRAISLESSVSADVKETEIS